MPVTFPKKSVLVCLDGLRYTGPIDTAIWHVGDGLNVSAPYAVDGSDIVCRPWGVDGVQEADHGGFTIDCDPSEVALVRCKGVCLDHRRFAWHDIGCHAVLMFWCLGLVPEEARFAAVLPPTRSPDDHTDSLVDKGATMLWSNLRAESPLIPFDAVVPSREYWGLVLAWSGPDNDAVRAAAEQRCIDRAAERLSCAVGVRFHPQGRHLTPEEAAELVGALDVPTGCDLALAKEAGDLIGRVGRDRAAALADLLGPSLNGKEGLMARRLLDRSLCAYAVLKEKGWRGSDWMSGNPSTLACELRSARRACDDELGAMFGALDLGVALEDVLPHLTAAW